MATTHTIVESGPGYRVVQTDMDFSDKVKDSIDVTGGRRLASMSVQPTSSFLLFDLDLKFVRADTAEVVATGKILAGDRAARDVTILDPGVLSDVGLEVLVVPSRKDVRGRSIRINWREVSSDPTGVGTSVTGATYVLQPSDNGRLLSFASACTVTVPQGLGPSFRCVLWQDGTGTVVINADEGVTMPQTGGTTPGRYASVGLFALGDDIIRLSGES